MKTAIFLGAGASAAEGAPVQNVLFKKYFANASAADKTTELYRGLEKYFETIFDLNLSGVIDWNDENNAIHFPTFEEALGVLDLSELRRESLRSFDSTSFVSNSNQVRLTRLYLVLAMSKAIADELERKRQSRTERLHTLLVENLKGHDLLRHTIFVSTNYDLLIDFALKGQFDYGVEFTGASSFARSRPVNPNSVKLLKIHGSLNWLHCPTCNNLTGFDYKVILGFIHGASEFNDYESYSEQTRCAFCRSILSPVVVPPTFYKDMSNVFLSLIWNKTENALREVDHVIFCGYSCPDADMHIKYLLKRMQTNRENSRKVRFTLINHHEGKDEKQAKDEEARYKRFFGANVEDTRKSFEDFAKAPKKIYRRLGAKAR